MKVDVAYRKPYKKVQRKPPKIPKGADVPDSNSVDDGRDFLLLYLLERGT